MSSKFMVSRAVEDGESVVRLSSGCWNPAAIFLIVWCAFWTTGITLAIHKVLESPREYFLYLWLTMALIAEVVVLWIILTMLFGKTVLTIRRGCGTSFTGIGVIGRTRRFQFRSEEDFSVEEELRSGKHGTHRVYVLSAPSQKRKGAKVGIYTDSEEEKVQALRREILSAIGKGVDVPVAAASEPAAEPMRSPAFPTGPGELTDYEAYFRNQSSR